MGPIISLARGKAAQTILLTTLYLEHPPDREKGRQVENLPPRLDVGQEGSGDLFLHANFLGGIPRHAFYFQTFRSGLRAFAAQVAIGAIMARRTLAATAELNSSANITKSSSSG
jgi:hypothetical protein